MHVALNPCTPEGSIHLYVAEQLTWTQDVIITCCAFLRNRVLCYTRFNEFFHAYINFKYAFSIFGTKTGRRSTRVFTFL